MFIFHSYACRKNKGAQKAVFYLKKSIHRNLFFYQDDIQSFFISINKNILYSILGKQVKNPEILWLSKTIIFHNPTYNYIQKGDLKLLQSIPIHKSLFEKYNCGLPIGNLTSQFFANVYLNELDQFIKHNLKCKKYFRYMDDFILIHSSKKQLIIWQKEIKIFVENNLNLKIHPKKQILQPIKYGLNFCGYIIKPSHILIRKRTVRKLKNKPWLFNQRTLKRVSPNKSIAQNLLFENPYVVFGSQEVLEDFQKIFSSINSTYGFLKHADCLNLKKALYQKHFGVLQFYLKPANRNYDYFLWKER